MGIVIVEGPDGSGKTTLLRNLRTATKRHFITLSRNGRPRKPDDLLKSIPWIASCPKEIDLVCDRHPLISEWIYGPHVRGENYLLPAWTVETSIRLLLATASRIIYCRPPLKTILDGVQVEGQMEGVKERIEKIVDLYDAFMDGLTMAGIRVIRYDWTGAALTMKYTGRTCDLENLFFGVR